MNFNCYCSNARMFRYHLCTSVSAVARGPRWPPHREATGICTPASEKSAKWRQVRHLKYQVGLKGWKTSFVYIFKFFFLRDSSLEGAHLYGGPFHYCYSLEWKRTQLYLSLFKIVYMHRGWLGAFGRIRQSSISRRRLESLLSFSLQRMKGLSIRFALPLWINFNRMYSELVTFLA